MRVTGDGENILSPNKRKVAYLKEGIVYQIGHITAFIKTTQVENIFLLFLPKLGVAFPLLFRSLCTADQSNVTNSFMLHWRPSAKAWLWCSSHVFFFPSRIRIRHYLSNHPWPPGYASAPHKRLNYMGNDHMIGDGSVAAITVKFPFLPARVDPNEAILKQYQQTRSNPKNQYKYVLARNLPTFVLVCSQ